MEQTNIYKSRYSPDYKQLKAGNENYSSKRILRHKNPLIIIPYFVATREEEIVTKMLANYNVQLITRKFKTQVDAQTINTIINEQPVRTEKDNN